MLLAREEVNPDKLHNDGVTPLSFAAQNRHEGAVKILLQRDGAYPDKPDKHGRIPL